MAERYRPQQADTLPTPTPSRMLSANAISRETGYGTGRIEAFSDGVFAIAITLLVLDLHLPGDEPAASGADLWAALLHLWPSYLAFVTSFVFIGIMWINHHRLFIHISRVDNALLLYNLLLLLGVTVLPFPTSLVARNLGHGGEGPAALVYNGLFVFIALAFNFLWRHAATGERLLEPDVDHAAVQRITRQYMFGPLLYLVTFALVWVSVPLSLALSLVLAAFFALPPPSMFAPLPPADPADEITP